MKRSITLFAALFFTALVAGGAFVIWIEYNPAGMSATFYTEKMQHGISVFTIPLPTIVILSIFFTVASAFVCRRERPTFYLLLAASVCTVAVAVITALGNVPINNQIESWNISSPPAIWLDMGTLWWRFQTARTIAAICGLSALILAVVLPYRDQGGA